VIFVDSNVPMYLVGDDPARKADSERLLERCVRDRESLVTDAEVFQEILHRYVAIRRPQAIQPAFDALISMTDDVFPIDRPSVERAKTIVLGYAQLSARDAIHLAVMERQGVSRILSFDRGLDVFPGIQRIDGSSRVHEKPAAQMKGYLEGMKTRPLGEKSDRR
jgi:predicted nucleic acid-binding protein